MIVKAATLGGLFLAACLTSAIAQNADPGADRSIKIVMGEDVDLLEPCMSTQSTIGAVLAQNISESLTYLDLRRGEGLQPKLAESWSQLPNGSWRFKLRQGVTFSDGSGLDARDVKHSFDRAMGDKIVCEVKRYFGGMTVSAEVVDDHTIDISSEPVQPIMPLLLSLLSIVPEETPLEFTRNPVGTGPYVLKEWVPSQHITLSERQDYWGAKPQVASATYVFRNDPAVRAAMITTGEAHIATSIAALDATNRETDFPYPDSETIYIRLDHSVAPISDIRVRKALNMAIDREAFIGTLLPEGTLLATALFPPPTLGWNKDVKTWAYDPEGARQLLAEAKADGVAVDTHLTLVARNGNFPNITEVMEAIQQQLQEAGFDVGLQFYEIAEYQKLYSKPYPTDRGPIMATAMHDNSKGDPSFTMFFKYASKGLQSGVNDAKVDDLIARASAATGDDRARLWSELQAYLHDDLVADLLLFHSVRFARVSTRLDWTPNMSTTSSLPLSEISFR
jgi:peptide/nickel transport system substrate-binding protein